MLESEILQLMGLQDGLEEFGVTVHEDAPITDLQWSPDRTYFITASKDKTAKVSLRPLAVEPILLTRRSLSLLATLKFLKLTLPIHHSTPHA